ncbi:MAG: TIGR03084 family metal-binding protein [Acidimicrobiales bacterium]
MTVDVGSLTADLAAEQAALDAVVAPLAADHWAAATPSPGWTIADQIGHLTYFDATAAQAIVDPTAFATARDQLFEAALVGGSALDDLTLATARTMEPADLLAAWRENRRALLDAAGTLADDVRVPWYGPSMSARSFLTARLMETWAHGQDVVDAAREHGLPADRPATDRLRHIAQLGVITRGWSYANRGLDAPDGDVRVELSAPSGATWTWGPEDATERVVGPAEDFCLVVTQRRHPHDTALAITGEVARDWMVRAQAFAVAATDGPAPTHS